MRAQRLSVETSDPERAQRNRVERDQLLARDVVESARRLRLKVVMVDGKRSLEEVADLVEKHFKPFLPASVSTAGLGSRTHIGFSESWKKIG